MSIINRIIDITLTNANISISGINNYHYTLIKKRMDGYCWSKLWGTAHSKDKSGCKYNAILEYITTILLKKKCTPKDTPPVK